MGVTSIAAACDGCGSIAWFFLHFLRCYLTCESASPIQFALSTLRAPFDVPASPRRARQARRPRAPKLLDFRPLTGRIRRKRARWARFLTGGFFWEDSRMVILALDYGERRIGVAVSDELEIAAHRLENIERDEEGSELDRIAELAAARNAALIVVGMPLNMDGSMGPQAHRVGGFVKRLRNRLPDLRVETIDERLTSAQAHRALSQEGATMRRRSERVDGMAAQLILARYLKQRARERGENHELTDGTEGS